MQDNISFFYTQKKQNAVEVLTNTLHALLDERG